MEAGWTPQHPTCHLQAASVMGPEGQALGHCGTPWLRAARRTQRYPPDGRGARPCRGGQGEPTHLHAVCWAASAWALVSRRAGSRSCLSSSRRSCGHRQIGEAVHPLGVDHVPGSPCPEARPATVGLHLVTSWLQAGSLGVSLWACPVSVRNI